MGVKKIYTNTSNPTLIRSTQGCFQFNLIFLIKTEFCQIKFALSKMERIKIIKNVVEVDNVNFVFIHSPDKLF